MYELKTNLKDFQKTSLKFIKTKEIEKKFAFLFNDTGTGKTIVVLALIVTSLVKSTLIVCPPGLIYNWVDEITKHTNITKNDINIYHGPNRKVLKNKLITITSYSTIASKTDTIKKHHFNRIILDECHNIKNMKTLKFESIYQLKTDSKILMSATPIYNSYDDGMSYISYVSDSDHNRISSMKKHEKIENIKIFLNNHSIQYKKKDVLKLPKKQNINLYVEQNAIEKEFYESLKSYSQNKIIKILNNIKILKNTNNIDKQNLQKLLCNCILVYILRLRQASNSPWIVMKKFKCLKGIKTIEDAVIKFNYCNNNNDDCCPVCLEEVDKSIKASPCGHSWCHECNEKMKNFNIITCPLCRQYIKKRVKIISKNTEDNVQKNKDEDDDDDDEKILKYQTSAKFEKIIELTLNIINNNQKVIITSCWVESLDILRHLFDLKDIKYCYIYGKTSVKNKKQIIDDFEKNNKYNVMFLSMLSSSEGLNLVSCNNMICVDLWWNGSCMKQIKDRIYRIGQTQDVTIYNTITSNTIEKNVMEMVVKKNKISNYIYSKNISSDFDKSFFDKIINLLDF